MTNFAFAPQKYAAPMQVPSTMMVPVSRPVKSKKRNTVSKAAVKKIVKSKNRTIRKHKEKSNENLVLGLVGGFAAVKLLGL